MLSWLFGQKKKDAGPSQAMIAVNAALTWSLAVACQKLEEEQHKNAILLGAIALQAGGELVLPEVFLNTILEGNYRLSTRRDEAREAVVIGVRDSQGEGEFVARKEG